MQVHTFSEYGSEQHVQMHLSVNIFALNNKMFYSCIAIWGSRTTGVFLVCTLYLVMFSSWVLHSRQKLVLTDVQKERAEVPPKEYQNRGSLQYQFGSELLQLPVHLFQITDVESQVKPSHWRFKSIHLGNNVGELPAFSSFCR